jgi:hypothetical protein
MLGLLGDTSSKDVRRATAVGILAQPQQALDLFATSLTDPADTADETGQPKQPSSGGCGVDARPPVTLYLHLSQESLTRDEHGVARFEGLGPVTVEQVRRWLGHCQVTVKPVIDLADQAPVDGYEVPDRLREAVQLRSPADVFPYATSLGRRKDADHTIAYVDPDHGGPPGQTALDNLGPMVRRNHRIKTHSRWQVTQVSNGVFVWRSPHGRLFLVDHTGTHPIFDTAA